MNNSLKFNYKFACMLLITLLLTIIAIALIPFECSISYADGQTAEIVFPSNDYIQSSSPSLISANENYLLVYDEDLSTLFVKTLDTNIDYKYECNFTSVENIYAVNNFAYISADSKIYKLDLTSTTSTPIEAIIPTPSKISSIATDGTYLYVKSIYGYVSVYHDDLTIAFEADNIDNEIFLGKSILAANDIMLYTFTNNSLNSYNLNTKETKETPFFYSVQSAYICNEIYAQINGESEIIIFNKDTKSIELNTGIQPDSYYAIYNKLYIIEGNVISVYTYNSLEKSLTLISSISMSGSDNKHLNNPKSILKLNDLMVVADSNNNRLSYIDDQKNMSILNLESKPIDLCSSSSTIFALCENDTVVKIVDKKITSTYSLVGITDITYLDKLYAIKNDGIYILLGGKFVKYLSLQNCNYISSYNSGKMIYAISNNSLFVVSKDGTLIKKIEYDFSNAIDFYVDYVGNLYILKDDSVTVLKNDLFALSINGSYSIPNSLSLTPNSFTLDGNYIYLTCDECVIVKDSFSSNTQNNTNLNDVDLSSSTFYYAIRENGNAIAYNQYGISDSIYYIKDDIIQISSKQYIGNYYYAKIGSNKFIVNIDDFSKINELPNSNVYEVKESSPIFEDLLGEQSTIINKNERITATSQLSILNSSYIKFNYNNAVYYIKLDNLSLVEQHSEEEPIIEDEPIKVYGKVQASRVGKKVNIYLSPNIDSTIIDSLKDGKKVEIVSENESFYYVSYNGTFGYIEKDNLIKSGVTKIQLIAIILSVIVVFAGMTIFLSYFYYKKKSE